MDVALKEETTKHHLLPQGDVHLLADALGHTHGRHPARLRAPHHPVLGVPILMQVLGHLQTITDRHDRSALESRRGRQPQKGIMRCGVEAVEFMMG